MSQELLKESGVEGQMRVGERRLLGTSFIALNLVHLTSFCKAMNPRPDTFFFLLKIKLVVQFLGTRRVQSRMIKAAEQLTKKLKNTFL